MNVLLSSASQSYKAMVGEKGEDAQASTKSIAAADGLRPVTEASDCSQENLLTTDTSETDGLNSTKLISLTKLKTQEEDRLKEKESEAASISLDFNQQLSPDHKESPVALAAVSRKEADSVPAAAGDSNGEEEEEEEAPADPGKKNCGGKGRSVGKRRSGRAANRR